MAVVLGWPLAVALLAIAIPVEAIVVTGVIETIVGGDNGDGRDAALANITPRGLAIDHDGNVYVADSDNHRIRRIAAATWVITTIAGQGEAGYAGDGLNATEALLNFPHSLAIDPADNLYFSDQSNHRVRRIDAHSGVITTIMGTGMPGETGLSYPAGVTTLSDGSVLVADSGNNRIRKWQPPDVVTTVAGTGISGFSGDGEAATAAQLANPLDVVADGAGNLYVADNSNCRIRRVDAQSRVITTLAGTGECLYEGDGPDARSVNLNGPGVLALARNVMLYVAELNVPRVRAINLNTGAINTAVGIGMAGISGDGGPANAALLTTPRGLLMDGDGVSLYVADFGARNVRYVDAAAQIDTVVGEDIGDGHPAALAHVAPHGLAWDSAGNMYIADSDHHRVRRVRSGGIIETIAGTGSPGYNGDDIQATQATLNRPSGITLDEADNVYVADQYNQRVRRIDAQSGVITTIVGTGAPSAVGVSYPAGLSMAPDGGVLIADSGNNRIRKWQPPDMVTTVAGTGISGFSGDGEAATAAQLANPLDLAADGAGNLYIADNSNCRIRRVDAQSRVITTLAGTGECLYEGDGPDARSVNLNGPGSLALHPSGTLYVGELYAPRVRAIDLTTRAIATVAGTGVPGSNGDGGPATSARFISPAALLLRPNPPSLFIADPDAGRVRMVELLSEGPPSPTRSVTRTATPFPSHTSTPPAPTGTRMVGTPTPTLPPGLCVCDCNRDGKVVTSELVDGLDIMFDTLDLSTCPECDANHDGIVAINEFVLAVDGSLSGCSETASLP